MANLMWTVNYEYMTSVLSANEQENISLDLEAILGEIYITQTTLMILQGKLLP